MLSLVDFVELNSKEKVELFELNEFENSKKIFYNIILFSMYYKNLNTFQNLHSLKA